MKFFPKTGGTPVDVMTDFCRAELERAAEECDQARVSLMCRSSVSMSISETVELLEYLTAAIRKLKE